MLITSRQADRIGRCPPRRGGCFRCRASLELLGRIVGTGRVQAQSRAAAAVAGQCGYLPLALRIAGARLAARPHWSIEQLADRLADQTRRLDELRHGEMGVRPSIGLSYEGASEQARRLFRRLGLLETPVFSGWVSAPLLGQPSADAEDALDELVAARMVEAAGTGLGVHSQYRLHDLSGVFARERLAAEEPAAEQKRALKRALGALFHLAEQAHDRYYGGDYMRIRSDAPRWPLPAWLAEQLAAIHWHGLSASVPRWSAGSGRQPRQGLPTCAGAWLSARPRCSRSAPTSTTGARPTRSP